MGVTAEDQITAGFFFRGIVVRLMIQRDDVSRLIKICRQFVYRFSVHTLIFSSDDIVVVTDLRHFVKKHVYVILLEFSDQIIEGKIPVLTVSDVMVSHHVVHTIFRMHIPQCFTADDHVFFLCIVIDEIS